MTWKDEIKTTIIRYAMRNGTVSFLPAESRKDIYVHVRECEPDLDQSTFTGTSWRPDDENYYHEGIWATVTCACGVIRDRVFIAEVTLVDLLDVIINE